MEIGRLQKFSFFLCFPASVMPSNVQVVLTLLHLSAWKWNVPIVLLSLWVPQVGDRQKRECYSICNWVYEDIIRRTFQGSSKKCSHQFHLFPPPNKNRILDVVDAQGYLSTTVISFGSQRNSFLPKNLWKVFKKQASVIYKQRKK